MSEGIVANELDNDIVISEFKLQFSQSAGAVEYTDCTSVEG